MSYNRKIFYMNFYEGDEKRGNAGYVKVLENKEVQEAEVRLSGISTVFDGQWELEILGEKKCLLKKNVSLQAGNGIASCSWDKMSELTGLSFRITLSGGCSVDSKERTGRLQKESAKPETITEEVPGMMIVEEREESETEMMQPQIQPEIVKEGREKEQEHPEKQDVVKDKVENRKWKQICKVYPHIQPFQDFRDYIKLDLKDMVLISERKYTLVENSFLLHGYYNYDHIILWKKEKAPVKYYIGVPGNFYEKEKQVAVLYGFESFEGAVEPAREGDFGYYMTEVTI